MKKNNKKTTLLPPQVITVTWQQQVEGEVGRWIQAEVKKHVWQPISLWGGGRCWSPPVEMPHWEPIQKVKKKKNTYATAKLHKLFVWWAHMATLLIKEKLEKCFMTLINFLPSFWILNYGMKRQIRPKRSKHPVIAICRSLFSQTF